MPVQRAVLLACGSFNPITNMHLRMFGKSIHSSIDRLDSTGRFKVVGGVISPVNDGYKKDGLLAASHRLAMCRASVANSTWIRTDDWELTNPEWQRTVSVLRHVRAQVNEGVSAEDQIRVKLLCGADLLESFATPGLWAVEDLLEIVGEFGIVCITRMPSDPFKFIYESDLLHAHSHNITIVHEHIRNEISSTHIRRHIRRGLSVRYLIPDAALDYIQQNNLYLEAKSQL
ncbi:nicotinate nucleotide adenylyltransferase [Capsaspora owczarzaki ATCC 30864]|uniref:Nicotinamide-nucleotide adenylyltransferase n=1 Tax=Capsaspora owczarzaki (strain ATCC 30864) TaxID=595528 RepID=A0A0D2VS90_CAPO3|nr:nicotinate nucleotide adenylyltransferase [Capsaspora owczarzaki ATCC 30864]